MKKKNEEEIKNFIQKYNLCHFKKVNLFGSPLVGKKTLLSYIEHYSDKAKDFEFKETIEKDIESENEKNENENEKKNSSLVELIKKISIPFYETKRLDINLHITNINNLDYIKENLDTLLFCSECIIVMIDICSTESFSSISELMPLIYSQMKKNIDYGDIPFFFISNKIDLEENREVSGFEVKELTDNYKNSHNFEISLKLEKNANDENINNFIIQLCNTISEYEKKYSFAYDSLNLVKIRDPMTVQNDSKMLQKADGNLSILLLGSQSVGKTSFARRLFENQFEENTLLTLGIDVVRTVAELYGNIEKIELWDTAGQERLRSIPKRFYGKADGFFLLFDVCDKKSFQDIIEWIKDIREARGNNKEEGYEKKSSDEVLILIGNKIDKVEERQVTKEEAANLAKQYNVKYCEISCKQGINIYEVFNDVIFDISSQNRRESTNFVIERRKSEIQNLNNPRKKKCC